MSAIFVKLVSISMPILSKTLACGRNNNLTWSYFLCYRSRRAIKLGLQPGIMFQFHAVSIQDPIFDFIEQKMKQNLAQNMQ